VPQEPGAAPVGWYMAPSAVGACSVAGSARGRADCAAVSAAAWFTRNDSAAAHKPLLAARIGAGPAVGHANGRGL